MKTATLSSLGESALRHVRKGISVFPVGADKKPLVKWLPYQTQRATEQEVVTWWTQWPDANIGMACGPVSRLVVLDLDGDEAQRELEQRGLAIPETWIVKTGRPGGRHAYFFDPGVRTHNFVKGKTDFPIPHVDFRGFGGYVIVPPSRHATGAVYSVEKQGPVATLPGWLLELVRDPEPTSARPPRPDSPDRPAHNGGEGRLAEKILVQALQRASDGTRNEMGLWLACQLRDNDFTKGEAESYLVRYAATVRDQGSHPYLKSEALESLRSAYSRP